MGNHVDMLPLFVVIVAFIAGYMIIGFIVTKIQESRRKNSQWLDQFERLKDEDKKESPPLE